MQRLAHEIEQLLSKFIKKVLEVNFPHRTVKV